MSWPFSSCPLLLVSYLSKTASSHFCSLMYACVAWVSVVWVHASCGLRGAIDKWDQRCYRPERCCGGAAEALLRKELLRTCGPTRPNQC